jgi:nucleoside-diphosphate-sugar epimerase
MPPLVNGSGAITRDYVYVADVVRANLLAALPSTGSRLTCNIAGGQEVSLLALLEAVCAASGTRVKPVIGPPRPGDIARSFADVSLARDALGFTATTPLADGILATVAWFGQTGRPARS